MSLYFEQKYLEIRGKITSWSSETCNDVYAISFWIDPINDDSRRICMVMGYNTVSYFTGQLQRASDAREAKWNFAYWLQNQELIIGGDDLLFTQWIKSTGNYYTDKELRENTDVILKKDDKIVSEFIQELQKIVRRLHNEKIIATKFGCSIPIIIHELEYHEQIAEQTQKANPEGVADEFIAWIKSMY